MRKTLKLFALLIVCMLVFSAFAGCAAGPPEQKSSKPDKSVIPDWTPTPAPTEEPLSESEILQQKAQEYLDTMGCPPAGADDNRLGLSITSIKKDGEDYIISWECSNPNAAGNEIIIFALMHFFDPDNFYNNYVAYETTANGDIQYTFKSGDLMTYTTFRINFEPDSKIAYLYFEGALPSNGTPDELKTQPLFFTLILGDEPMVLEPTPRLAGDIFDKYITDTAAVENTTNSYPLIMTAFGNTYIIDSLSSGTDEYGYTTVKITGSGLDVLPYVGEDLYIPIGCAIISNGTEYVATTAKISANEIIYGFDTTAAPDTIVLFPYDDKDNRIVFEPEE